MRELLAAFHGAVYEEEEDEQCDGAERADDADNGVLARLAAVRTAARAGAPGAVRIEVGVHHGVEAEAGVDTAREGLGDAVVNAVVEQ